MTPRRSARRASFSEMINDNVKDVRATRVKEIGDVEGSLLVVPTNDEYMGKYMLESGKVWEEHVLLLPLRRVRPGRAVLLPYASDGDDGAGELRDDLRRR